MSALQQGLYRKFNVVRTDGQSEPGSKHENCEYFVLDVTHDKHALSALAAYAASCSTDFPELSADLRAKVMKSITADNLFVQVPETTLPGGVTVPAFQVGQYVTGRGPMDIPVVNALTAPWVEISYHEAREASAGAGLALITELQALAIAYSIANQPINWTGGAVGEGNLFQGLHKGSVDEPQAGNYVSKKEAERRWHELSNGARVYDFSGNVYTWVYDDVQGDASGVVARAFTAESPSISTAPFPSMTKGAGWQPRAASDWSGDALVRGGYWVDGDGAGVFALDYGSPGRRVGHVGFRCTKPLGV